MNDVYYRDIACEGHKEDCASNGGSYFRCTCNDDYLAKERWQRDHDRDVKVLLEKWREEFEK